MSDVEWSRISNNIDPGALVERFKAIAHLNEKLLQQVMSLVSQIPHLEAKRLAPEKTGLLIDAILRKRDSKPWLVNATENYQIYVKTKGKNSAWYAVFVHNATEKNQEPLPFLTLAFESTKDDMLKKFEVEFVKRIKTAEKQVQSIK